MFETAPRGIMNAPTITAVAARASQFFGWVAEQSGRAVGAPTIVSMGRHRQLRAAVALRCAQVKGDANRVMRTWKLLDTRLLNVSVTPGAR